MPTLGTDVLSVQLYTVREALTEDVDGTLARIAEIGYKLVEPFGFQKFFDGLSAGLSKYGLSAPTTTAAWSMPTSTTCSPLPRSSASAP